MFYKIMAILLMAVFYAFYFSKIMLQNKQGIKTNQMGLGDKSRKVLLIERLTAFATCSVFLAGVLSIFLMKDYLPATVRNVGIVIGIVAIAFFALATITMKTSWRVGIPKEKTKLVTNGIYRISRNPAFVGFDLLYISICLMFFNIALLVISLFAIVMLHLQILQEEEHMQKMFGEEYEIYKLKISRYIALKPSH